MLKSELREIYRQKRAALHPQEIAEKSMSIANHALALDVWQLSYFHLFLNPEDSSEVDTTPLLTLLQGRDKHVVVPKVEPPRSLSHYLLTDNTRLVPNRWGIPEPIDGIEVPADKIDVVFIPLLVYDKEGNRLGYGKGFYDGFLHTCRPDCLRIGLSFFKAEKTSWEVEEHDIPLDGCLHPEGLDSFSGKL